MRPRNLSEQAAKLQFRDREWCDRIVLRDPLWRPKHRERLFDAAWERRDRNPKGMWRKRVKARVKVRLPQRNRRMIYPHNGYRPTARPRKP